MWTIAPRLCWHQTRTLATTAPTKMFRPTKQNNSHHAVENTCEINKSEVKKSVDASLLEKVKSELSSDSSTGKVFAVVMAGGTQFKVAQHDIIMLDKKIEADIGERIRLEKVLLAGGHFGTLLGLPLLKRDVCHVEAMVMEKTRGEHKHVFKKKRRKRYKKWLTHRQDLSVLKITNIDIDLESV